MCVCVCVYAGECIEVWMLVQRKWMYLESIFVGSDDIRLQLPQEAKRFDGIDKQWHKIMSDTAKNTNVLEACSMDGRLTTLQVRYVYTRSICYVTACVCVFWGEETDDYVCVTVRFLTALYQHIDATCIDCA